VTGPGGAHATFDTETAAAGRSCNGRETADVARAPRAAWPHAVGRAVAGHPTDITPRDDGCAAPAPEA